VAQFQKRRLLFLLPFAPQVDAAHGGGRVIGQFLSHIVGRHQVAVVYMRSQDEPGPDDFFRERCVMLEEVERPFTTSQFWPRLRRRGRLARALSQRRPMWVADWASKAYDRRVNTVTRQFQPDIIQVEYQVMGQYLTALNGCRAPRLLVAHEPGSRAAPYLGLLPSLANSLINSAEKRAWRRYETAVFSQVQAIITFTDADRQAVGITAGPTPVHVIRPGFTIPPRPLNPVGSSPLNILFIGNFIHPPNVEAAFTLIHSIWPTVRAHQPEATLTIIGDRPPRALQEMASENVIVTGRVSDVTPYLDRASLFVAPMRSGGGIRIKLLEALAAGKAVVATPLAAEGLDLSNGEQIYLAWHDDQLARRIVELLTNLEKRAALATRARAWACTHLGWSDSIRRYEALYAKLLES
jgi:polysaccharide biosynthesis protein PslH